MSKIDELETKVAALEARLEALEFRTLPIGPAPTPFVIPNPTNLVPLRNSHTFCTDCNMWVLNDEWTRHVEGPR